MYSEFKEQVNKNLTDDEINALAWAVRVHVRTIGTQQDDLSDLPKLNSVCKKLGLPVDVFETYEIWSK